MIEFRTLGRVDLRDPDNGDGLDSILSRSKRVGLLAYLALNLGFQRRDRLFALFWPEIPEDRARKALNQATYVLRKFLGPDVLLSRGDGDLGLDPEAIWCDAIEFDGRLKRGQLGPALALYNGDLLPAFHLSDCPDFERWLDEERGELRRQALQAARTLAAEYEARGNVVEAAFWLRRAAARSPYDESILRELLQLLGRHGDRAGAMREYEAFESRFSEDLGLEPSPETTELIDRVRDNGFEVQDGSARADVAAPDAETGDAAGATRGDGRLPRLRWPLAAAAAVVVVSLGLFASRLSGDPELPSGIQPKRLLVAVFANEMDADADVSLGMLASDRVAEGLARSGLVEVVPPSETSRWRQVLVEEGYSADDPAIVQATAERAGAGLLVTGSYAQLGDTVEFRARVIDVRSGTLLRSVGPIAVAPAEPDDGVDQLGSRLQGAVGTVVDPRFSDWSGAASLPPDLASYRKYADAVDLYRESRLPESAAAFIAAASTDSSFTAPIVWAAFVRVMDWYGSEHLDDEKLAQTRAVVETLRSRRDFLPAWERAMFAHVEAMLRLDFRGAHEAMRTVVEAGPGTEWLLRLATLAFLLDRPREVLSVMSRIDPSDETFERHRRRYWGLTLSAHHRLGEFVQELQLARSLKTSFAGWARLHQIELRALAALGRDEEVEQRLAILFEGTPATALTGLNMELNAHGYGEYAKQITRSSLALLSDEPVEARDDHWKFRRGSQLATLGRDDEALAQLAEILPDSPRYLDARQVVGEIAARSADRVTALRVSAEMDAVRQEGLRLYYQAIIAAELGERERAVALLRRSQNPVRAPMHRELSFPDLQGYPPFEELERPRGP